jgi:competence protein ComFB
MLDNEKYKEVRARLENHTEVIVLQTIEELLSKEEYNHVSQTENILVDIATYSLNRLPPKYVATQKGEVYTKAEELKHQHSVDILTVVAKAIKVITEN